MVGVSDSAFRRIERLSNYFDRHLAHNKAATPEYILYARTAKLIEECGEVMEAVIGWTGDNPRKGRTHDIGDIQMELCDVILTAMCALHTTTQDRKVSVHLINERIRFVETRLATREDYNASTQHVS